MKKRLLSAILSFCMLLTMAPTVAFAADGDDEAANTISLADATETSGTSTTIKDIYLRSPVVLLLRRMQFRIR